MRKSIFLGLVVTTSLYLPSAAAVSTVQNTGTLTGVVTTKAAGLPSARATIDQNVCGNEVADETIVRDAAGQVANAVITLAGVKSSNNAPAAGVLNEKCRFSPHVQIVRPNATITTSSTDPMLHTTNAANAAGKTLFNVALPLPGIKITKAVGPLGVVRLNCNTHPWMRGWIVVTDDMAAISGGDGKFTMPTVPAGTYEVRLWHEQLKAPAQTITVAAGQTANVTFIVQ
jgi:plastocyanin